MLLSFLLALLTGCETKAKARAQARAAYLAGQQQGREQMIQQGPTVLVVGNVQNHTVPWTDGLTLAGAIVQADYLGVGTPTQISVFRNGEILNVDPQRLLRGNDVPLEAGDRIDIRP